MVKIERYILINPNPYFSDAGESQPWLTHKMTFKLDLKHPIQVGM